MGEILTYGHICKAIATALKTTTGVIRVEAYDELSEGVPDWPMLQVYPDNGEVDTGSEDTERATFGAGVRRTSMLIIVRGYARPRSHLAEDLKAQVELIDAIDARLSDQKQKPFGVPGIRAFNWKWERATYSFAEGDVKSTYAACQFTIEVTVF